MRYINSIVLVTATLLAGCSHSPQMVHTPAPARIPAAAPSFQPKLITTRGTNTLPDGTWQVAISEADGSLHLSRFGVTTGVQGWTAQKGWFAFIESESRVWAYDGDRALYLLTATPSLSEVSGPRRFSSAVPTQVFSRLSESAQRAIESHE